jgi:hypothetical protein
VAEDDEDDGDGDEELLDQRLREGAEGLVDQAGAVVEGDDGDLGAAAVDLPARQARGDLGDPGADSIDDGERRLSITDDDDAADDLGAAEIEGAPAQGRAEADAGDVAHADRGVVAGADDDLLEIFRGADEAEAADHVLDAVDLEGAGADVEVGAADGVGDLAEVDAGGEHGLGIDVDLVLADMSADAGDLGDARDALQGEAHGPVLDGAQLVEGEGARDDVAALVEGLEGVPKDLAEGGGVGAERGG